MKITIITETFLPFIAGVSTSTDNIARFLAKNGHEVTVICPHPVLPIPPPENKFKIIYTPSFKDPYFVGKPTSFWPLPLFILFKEITKKNTDLVHIQEPGALGVAALFFAKLHKIPTVGALHLTPEQIIKFIKINPFNLSVLILNKLLSSFYNSCNAVMVPTQTFKKILVEKLHVHREIAVVSNGVDVSEFIPRQKDLTLIEKFQLPQNKVFFFFLGRLDKDKNISTVIKALKNTNPAVHLVIAGLGKEEEELKKEAVDLGVNQKISWVGKISEEEFVKIYNLMDCFILMSPYEVQSIVVLQAISCGLPVICSNEGALPELCHDGENGFLINTFDDKTLCEKMNLLSGDENLRKVMGKKSREIALPHDRVQNFQKLEELYIQITK